VIGSSQTLSNEYRYLRASQPAGDFELFMPRQRGHEYSIDHFGGHFYIRTNDGAENFRLMRAPVGRTAREHWEEVLPHRDDVLLQNFEIFRDHLVVSERRNGLPRLRIRPWTGSGEHYIEFEEPSYLAYISTNREFDTRLLRFGYTSLTTPTSIYDYDMQSRERELLKRDEVLGGYDPADYRTERLEATARDGTRVPVSLVYRREQRRDGPQPLLLYGYGAYGASTEPTFSSIRLSLLDRGFIYAIAHVRGGQELGRRWYDDGKLLKKQNTFTDFIDVAEHLVARHYTSPGHLYAQGGSAGGLLMGAVINIRPDLFHGVIAAVPFVDVVTTMLDASIPLTTGEYDEWGNPNDPTYYKYMLSYSPYDNVTAQQYPHLLVTSGLHDSQVQFWEPTKWVARLRARREGDSRLLLRTNMEAGHGGASGRYRRWREIAFEYAFLLDLAGGASGAGGS
jgi:oligopeptidase B